MVALPIEKAPVDLKEFSPVSSVAGFSVQLCAKQKRYLKHFDVPQLRLVCGSTERRYTIKAGFFLLAVVLTMRSVFPKA